MRDEPYWWVRAKQPHYHPGQSEPCAQLPPDWREPQRFEWRREIVAVVAGTVFLVVAFTLIILTIGALGGGS